VFLPLHYCWKMIETEEEEEWAAMKMWKEEEKEAA
jgi:hypothetical protein